MIDFVNEFTSIISMYVDFLFSLEFLSGVSIGSIFLVASLLFVIVRAFWVRGK